MSARARTVSSDFLSYCCYFDVLVHGFENKKCSQSIILVALYMQCQNVFSSHNQRGKKDVMLTMESM